ncbi:FkbM family methyltransferase [Ohtaekwangia koreensis]|uniref:Methyltransferase, FkbM family n=1 Tax=Ohtaekwangia koreensis TaxID=688867 RepID=A0A1T5JC43_9BACT|nr:FkbM family methyltransferase [Ohtaekwangia koreensis]SKC48896.1 methyltransferase, FkbM family [Ohtaekwangia koreensis]
MKLLLKKIYNFIPFKLTLFSALRLLWKPPASIYQHLHFTGVFNVVVEEAKSFKIKHYGYQIENEIFWEGLTSGWEKESINLWIKLCKDAEVIFDLGANTGVYSLIAKTLNPNSKVYAFEPVERVFKKFQENISLNQFDIVSVEKAVSNSNGTATIYDTASEHIYSVTVNKNLASSDTHVIETKINTVTLNSFFKENNITKADLFKIDVETHEPEVLEGFSDYLFQCRPTILIEILTDEVGEKIDTIFKGSGYLYFNINENGGIRQVDKITKSDYYNYLLCSQAIASKLGLLQ